jgi:hypothetical protein
MTNFKQKIATYISTYRIINFIKKSKKNAFIVGNEMASIYCIVYNEFKNVPNIFNNLDIYSILLKHLDYKKSNIIKFLNKNIDFSKLFSILNTKILKLKDNFLWDYLRGYYINDLDIYTNNLNGNSKQFWFVIYDFHLHYLLFIYTVINKDLKNIRDVDFLLNNSYDNYSLNYITDELNYKIVFTHQPNKFNDSIKFILNKLYLNVTSESQLFSKDDIILYRKYISYLN